MGGVLEGSVAHRVVTPNSPPHPLYLEGVCAVDVPAVDDPRILIPIPVPVKGRKTPFVLRLPRFDFLTEDQHDAMQEAAEAASKGLPYFKAMKAAYLAQLKNFVNAKDFAVCETLAVGQLSAISAVWGEKSGIPLGEFLASADSSTVHTEAPSSTTSTAADGHA